MELLVNEPKSLSSITFILAHGAGAPMDSEFMEAFAKGIAENGFRCVRFEFPYMNERRKKLNKRPPDKLDNLIHSWKSVINQFRGETLVIGGKSMGGRIASLIADDSGVLATILLGYPFITKKKHTRRKNRAPPKNNHSHTNLSGHERQNGHIPSNQQNKTLKIYKISLGCRWRSFTNTVEAINSKQRRELEPCSIKNNPICV